MFGTIYHTNTYELSNYPAGLVAILRSGAASSVPAYNTPLNYKDLEHNQSFFAQDKWIATRKLTVSASPPLPEDGKHHIGCLPDNDGLRDRPVLWRHPAALVLYHEDRESRLFTMFSAPVKTARSNSTSANTMRDWATHIWICWVGWRSEVKHGRGRTRIRT